MNSNFFASLAFFCLEVTSAPRTPKVLGSNLIRIVYFFEREIVISKNCQLIFSDYVLWAQLPYCRIQVFLRLF